MASYFIPIQVDLSRRREVLSIAGTLGISRHAVVGLLVDFWGWAQAETTDGKIVGISVDACVDALTSHTCDAREFLCALQTVGWLEIDGEGMTLPNFDRWLSSNAKSKLLKNKRQQRWREKKAICVDAKTSTQASTTTQHNTTKSYVEERAPSVTVVFPESLDTETFRFAWKKWRAYRRERRLTMTPTCLNAQLKKLAEWGHAAAIDSIDSSITNGWAGIFPPKPTTLPDQSLDLSFTPRPRDD